MKRKLMWELEFNLIGNESTFYLVNKSYFDEYRKRPWRGLLKRRLCMIRSLPNTNPPILEAEVLHTVLFNGQITYVLPDEIEF